MSSASSNAAIPAETIDAAIDWTVKLNFNSPTVETRQAFERWLQADVLHAEAWRRVQSLHAEFAGVPPLLALDTLQATAQLRRKTAGLQRRQLLKLLALTAATTAIGWQSRSVVPWQRLVADTSTGIGERRQLRFDDGSQLLLNTDSAVDSALDATPRSIRLRRGEIWLASAGQSIVPLQVQTPYGVIETAAARLIVRLETDRVRVTVQQGRAQLFADGIESGAEAQAGESWWLREGAATPATPLAFDAAGWIDGVIAARDMRLVDLLAELARYRRGRVHCDARIAERPVSGIYHIDDTDQALRFLAQTQSLRLDYRTRFWVGVVPVA